MDKKMIIGIVVAVIVVVAIAACAVFVLTDDDTKHYTIEYSAGANGTISATEDGDALKSGDTVCAGDDVRFVAAPATGYEVAQWTINGTAVDTTGTTLNIADVQEDKDVKVTFSIIECDLKFTTTNGSDTTITSGTTDITAGAKYDYGTSVTFTVDAVADPGYYFTEVTGATANTDGSYTVVMNGNKTVTIGFKAYVADDVMFLIEDYSGVYFWMEGNGITVLDAFKDAAAKNAVTYLEVESDDGTNINGINGLNNIEDSYYWALMTYVDGAWIYANYSASDEYSENYDYVQYVYVADEDGVETVYPDTPDVSTAAAWEKNTEGVVFAIESSVGLKFYVNGTSTTTMYDALKNASETYGFQLSEMSSWGGFSSMYNLESVQDEEGNYTYWTNWPLIDGAWSYSDLTVGNIDLSGGYAGYENFALYYGSGTPPTIEPYSEA